MRLSVVVGTTQPWPEAERVLKSLYAQTVAAGGEVLLAVRGPECTPPREDFPELRIVEGSGETVFELRARAIAAARGDVVAITEDHCVVARDWCARLLDAHARLPEADIIGGAVQNGAHSPIGWAGFLVSNGPFLAPLETIERPIVTGHANVSYKRRALRGWGVGTMDEGRYREELWKSGGHLFTDGSIRIFHIQSFPGLAMCRYIFHGGRTLAGHQRAHLSRVGWLARLAKVLLGPVRVIVNTPRLALRAARRGREYRRPAATCMPWLAALLCFYYAGELTGHLAGPGASPHHLR